LSPSIPGTNLLSVNTTFVPDQREAQAANPQQEKGIQVTK
jgi:hypothetical protein